MIIAIVIALNIIAAYTALLIYTAGLTRTAPNRLGIKATRRAALILRDLEQPYHAFLAEGGFNNSYHYNRNLMPVILKEARVIAQTSGDLPTLALFGLFLTVYALVWSKTRIRANREDLRSLIGTEILLQKACHRGA